jgi:hypothetical protein
MIVLMKAYILLVFKQRSKLRMKKVYTNGRPAWYDQDGALRSPFVVGVAGGSASGILQ